MPKSITCSTGRCLRSRVKNRLDGLMSRRNPEAFVHAGVGDADDVVTFANAASDAAFLDEAGVDAGLGGEMRQNELDGAGMERLFVFGFVDHGHATLAQNTFESVASSDDIAQIYDSHGGRIPRRGGDEKGLPDPGLPDPGLREPPNRVLPRPRVTHPGLI